MATTPEGAVKKMVRATLKEQEAVVGKIYFFMPVQNGFGQATLDFLGAARGRSFAVETKAPGKHPTPRQLIIIEEMKAAGVRVFIIDGEKGCKELRAWLNGLID